MSDAAAKLLIMILIEVVLGRAKSSESDHQARGNFHEITYIRACQTNLIKVHLTLTCEIAIIYLKLLTSMTQLMYSRVVAKSNQTKLIVPLGIT